MKREDLVNNLKLTLRNMSLEQFSRLFINEVQAVEEFYKLTCGMNSGKTISLLFNPHRLNIITEAAVTRTSAPMSVYASLSDKGNEKYTEKIDGMARLYLYNLEHGTSNPFYATVQRGYNGVAYVNEFPPLVARDIYIKYNKQKYQNHDRISVLDPCCGWGGRMIGCASIPNTRYVGCEPSTETHKGLLRLGEWLKTLQPTFEFEIHNVPYEDYQTDEKFDMALTSPPYYDTEHYCDEDTNSLNRYHTYDEWVDGFYRPLIINTLERVRGVFILNIGDRKYPLTQSMNEICGNKGLFCERLSNFLSTNDDAGEKFYCLSAKEIGKKPKQRKLF